MEKDTTDETALIHGEQTADQIIERAVAFHRNGQLQEAERLYRAVLGAQPLHPDANHNFGILLAGVNQPAAALPFLKSALEANPAVSQYWLSYINMLLVVGRVQEAGKVLEMGRQRGLSGPAGDALMESLERARQQQSSQGETNYIGQPGSDGAGTYGPEETQTFGFAGLNYNIVDIQKFRNGIELIKESLLDKDATFFCSDNLITWSKTYSLLRDEFIQSILADNKNSDAEKTIVWRTYCLLYFAELSSAAEGDYLELGCHTGFTAAQVIKKVDFVQLSKKYFLYDLFEWKEGDGHPKLDGHNNPKMCEDVISRFAMHDFVKVVKGSVPQSFAQAFPNKVAFAHIDMNHPEPEAGALEIVLPKLSKGGVIVLDDYGWLGYIKQKIAIDPIVKKYNLSVLELPTGQGIIINL